MTWFAFTGYQPINVAGAQEKNLVAWGFHGYGSKAQAEAHPNSVNFAQKLVVNLAELDYYGSSPNPSGGALGTFGQVPKTIAGQVTSIGTSWISDLFSAGGGLNMFVRIGEVLLGLVLVAIGVAKMTSAVPIATAIARKAGTKGLA